ncbi:predicted protein [Uncinocarpus reesii 1704]|uniref:Uncharacterized protein n=1 Tax=Uncinocarpus reesii (strain UAMH 1704) TaxID=336963 RepID=C4JHN8_UNCRE|nr:uncharacterized protein UREG_02724 [Uncinocarpus reesii 1704]EEP77875.1 predicted protein [Uncinocarpus reesii 1704]
MATPTLNKTSKLLPVPLSTAVRHSDPFVLIERQSRQLQDDLQLLLDAQSAGLSAGLSNTANDYRSTGSSTPTPSHLASPRTTMTIPIRQPTRKKISLKGARRGILKSMDELLTLKEEERRIVDVEIGHRRDAVREVDAFISKQKGLESVLTEAQREHESLRIQNLQRESRNLEKHIMDLENQLGEMKARHRQMLNEITHLQNSIDSKLSSYRESLALVHKDVQIYLQSPPIQPLRFTTSDTPTFYTLHPKRRTLEMAKEHWHNEGTLLRQRRRKADHEISALKEGGRTWHKVISTISSFETSMQKKMSQIIRGFSGS